MTTGEEAGLGRGAEGRGAELLLAGGELDDGAHVRSPGLVGPGSPAATGLGWSRRGRGARELVYSPSSLSP